MSYWSWPYIYNDTTYSPWAYDNANGGGVPSTFNVSGSSPNFTFTVDWTLVGYDAEATVAVYPKKNKKSCGVPGGYAGQNIGSNQTFDTVGDHWALRDNSGAYLTGSNGAAATFWTAPQYSATCDTTVFSVTTRPNLTQ